MSASDLRSGGGPEAQRQTVPPQDLTGNRPPYAPEHLANFWISQSFRNGLTVGGGARGGSSAGDD